MIIAVPTEEQQQIVVDRLAHYDAHWYRITLPTEYGFGIETEDTLGRIILDTFPWAVEFDPDVRTLLERPHFIHGRTILIRPFPDDLEALAQAMRGIGLDDVSFTLSTVEGPDLTVYYIALTLEGDPSTVRADDGTDYDRALARLRRDPSVPVVFPLNRKERRS